jgi:hypothetical protein
MNILPNEILLKIFCKVDWEYQLYHPLNVICKKWNNLITQYGIDFDTDYNTILSIYVTSEYEKLSLSTCYYEKQRYIKIEFKKNDNPELLQKLLLKIPTANLELNYYDFPYNQEIIKFHNKHVRWLKCSYYEQHYSFKLRNLEYLVLHKTKVTRKLINNSNLKEIYFSHINNIDLKIFNNLTHHKNKVNKLKFYRCIFDFYIICTKQKDIVVYIDNCWSIYNIEDAYYDTDGDVYYTIIKNNIDNSKKENLSY